MTNVPSASETVSNVQDNTVDETDNPHLTIPQEQVPQYSQYMSTVTSEQYQFTSVLQEQQQFTGLPSISGDPVAPAVPMQPGVVDNLAGTTQQLLMPTWTGTGEPVTQNTAQTGDGPPHFNTAAIPSYNNSDNQFIGSNISTGVEQNRDASSSTMYSVQYGNSEAPAMYSEGLNAQYTGTNTQQPIASMLPHANQPSLYSNFTSQAPGTEPADSHNLMPQQPLSTSQPVMSFSQPLTGISQPPTSAVPTAVPPPTSSQSQQPEQKKEPSSKEDTGILFVSSKNL